MEAEAVVQLRWLAVSVTLVVGALTCMVVLVMHAGLCLSV
jgi:hypothetical protein